MILLVIGIILVLTSIGIFFASKDLLKINGKTNKDLTIANSKQLKINQQLDKDASALKQIIKQLEDDKRIAIEARTHAVEMAGKELELELAKQKESYTKKLDEELEKMRAEQALEKTNAEHALEQYKELIQQLEAKIEERRTALRILQDQQQRAEEKDDFVKTHSLGLSIVEKSDIALIRGFAPKLVYKDVLYKLIWSQFYQPKLQVLRKSLNADKVTGIYKITHIKNNKTYIGQSTDIGTRWCDHVKAGLSIGVTRPNKFYSAMLEDGPEAFTYEILEICDKSKLDEKERYWIDFYNSIARGYNTKTGG